MIDEEELFERLGGKRELVELFWLFRRLATRTIFLTWEGETKSFLSLELPEIPLVGDILVVTADSGEKIHCRVVERLLCAARDNDTAGDNFEDADLSVVPANPHR